MADVKKNRVLVFNGYYLPAKKYGGPLTSLVKMIEACSDENIFYVVASNHDYKEKTLLPGVELGWKDVGKAKVLYTETEKLNWNLKSLEKIIDKVQPDMVWLVGIVVPREKWPLALLCRRKGIPYLISPRGGSEPKCFSYSLCQKKSNGIIHCFVRIV